MRQFVGIVMLAGALGSTALAQSGLGLIPPDAGFVLGVEWRKIVDSPLGVQFYDQIKKNPMVSTPEVQRLQDALLRDVDSMVIAMPASALAKAKSNPEPPVLFVVKGRFQLDQLRSLAKEKAPKTETYRAVELIALPDSAPTRAASPAAGQNRIAFLDANTILGGDRDQVRAAIDRVKTGHPTAARAGLLSGAAALASKNDVWMLFDLPPDALKEAPPAAAQMFAAVKGAELGLSFEQGLGLLVNIRTRDAESAVSMAQTLQGLMAMGAMSQSQSPQVGELVKKIRIVTQSSRVSLSLSLDQNEVKKMVEQAKTSFAAGSTASSAARATPPASRGPIRIIGLDGGPIEVQPTAPKK
jgi:hypothetical protein